VPSVLGDDLVTYAQPQQRNAALERATAPSAHGWHWTK
jgi:hypothetical protein